jgi:hypothetical protein
VSRSESPIPPPSSGNHHIFVDFENVPTVDLSLIGDKPAEVILLIGEKQRRLELGLVRQIHEHAAKVTLVEVGASGRNALDLVLAWHLGKTAERHPDDTYFVVSKDKDFDPLLTHLRARGLHVQRVDSFTALPFLESAAKPRRAPATRPSETTRTRTRRAPRAALAAAAVPEVADDRFAKLVDRLQHKTKARPVRWKRLLSHINGFYRNQLDESALNTIAATLERRNVIAVDPNGRVSYPDAGRSGTP